MTDWGMVYDIGLTTLQWMSTPDLCQPWFMNCGGSPMVSDSHGYWNGPPQWKTALWGLWIQGWHYSDLPESTQQFTQFCVEVNLSLSRARQLGLPAHMAMDYGGLDMAIFALMLVKHSSII